MFLTKLTDKFHILNKREKSAKFSFFNFKNVNIAGVNTQLGLQLVYFNLNQFYQGYYIIQNMETGYSFD